MDTVKLGTLHAILTGTDYDFQSMTDACVFNAGKGGPWVFQVPTDLVNRLAALDGEQLANTGAAWAATEEFSPEYENWPPEAVQQRVADLAALARRAVDTKKALLMWVSR